MTNQQSPRFYVLQCYPYPNRQKRQTHSAYLDIPHANTMEAVNIPSENVPAELKAPCEQILKRAKELKKAEPVEAYWCCFSAAQKAMKAPGRSGEGTRFLMTLLDTLESMKAVLSENEAVNNEAAGAGYVENFALKVFMSADNDDRAGITGKATIRKFVVAGQFIEVLRCFENGMTDEMEQKLQYARWKAADGAKALREGREPVSGPPMPESEINPFPELPVGSPGVASTQLQSSPGMTRGSFSSTTRPIMSPPPNNPSPAGSTPLVSPRPSPGRQARSNLPGLDTSSRENMNANSTPSRTDSFASGAWSTVATPGVADEEGREKRFDLSQGSGSPLPSAPPLEPKSPTGDRDRKNVRFAGPDGAPLSPAQTHITVDSYDTPDAPPPTTTSSSPTTPMPPANFQIPSSSSSSDPSSRARGDSTSSSSRQISNGTGNGTGNGFGTNFPSAPPPSLATAPSAPPVVPQPHGLGLSSPPPSAPTMPALTSAPPTRKQVEQTQKHARWAISALEFDDIETARSELRKALATIGG